MFFHFTMVTTITMHGYHLPPSPPCYNFTTFIIVSWYHVLPCYHGYLNNHSYHLLPLHQVYHCTIVITFTMVTIYHRCHHLTILPRFSRCPRVPWFPHLPFTTYHFTTHRLTTAYHFSTVTTFSTLTMATICLPHLPCYSVTSPHWSLANTSPCWPQLAFITISSGFHSTVVTAFWHFTTFIVQHGKNGNAVAME
jgi:hypothetical protein